MSAAAARISAAGVGAAMRARQRVSVGSMGVEWLCCGPGLSPSPGLSLERERSWHVAAPDEERDEGWLLFGLEALEEAEEFGEEREQVGPVDWTGCECVCDAEGW